MRKFLLISIILLAGCAFRGKPPDMSWSTHELREPVALATTSIVFGMPSIMDRITCSAPSVCRAYMTSPGCGGADSKRDDAQCKR